MVDHSAAIPMYVPTENVFLNQNNPRWLVIHKTAQPECPTAQCVAQFFAHDRAQKSTHYIVGMDGTIVQCVAEKDGAGGNCCLEVGHDSFWPTGINLNLVTISIEHVDPTPDNSTPVTAAQKQASFSLVADICKRHNIAAANIVGHHSISPISRALCPGNYPMEELKAYVNSQLRDRQGAVPMNWIDDGMTLKAPNGHTVKSRFRDFILKSHTWNSADMPLEEEETRTTVEESNPNLGAGSRQIFVQSVLEWTTPLGVKQAAHVGQELLFVIQDRAKTQATLNQAQSDIASLQTEIATLKTQLASTQQSPPSPTDLMDAIKVFFARLVGQSRRIE